MSEIIVYHGSPDKEITPTYGLGEDKHDYGRGFYLTADADLAKEWAVCRPDEKMDGFINLCLIQQHLTF